MLICTNCGLPVPSTRRVCPGCEEPLAQPEATDDAALDDVEAVEDAPNDEQLEAVRTALARQADRGWHHETFANSLTRRGARRWMVVAAVVVAVLGSMFVVNPFGGDARITASTPIDELPWAAYSAPDESFAINLPGVPAASEVTRWNGLALTRYELNIPGAFLAVSVLVPGGTQAAATVAANRAQELGAHVSWQQETRGALGVDVEASFSDGTTGGWMQVMVGRRATYVIDVRTNGDAPKARALFDRLTGSFHRADVG